MDRSEAILELVQEVGSLKNLPRSGWGLRGIRGAESVADHSYRMVFLSMLLADELCAAGEALDAERVLRMAVLHEIGEARLGDIPRTAGRWLGDSVKEGAEDRAVRDQLAPLDTPAHRYAALWEEFAAGVSREARLVRAADKLEMIIQASEYELAGARRLDEFFAAPANQPFFEEFPVIQRILAVLRDRRAANTSDSPGGGTV